MSSSNLIATIDPNALAEVTGGGRGNNASAGSGIDGLLSQLNSITSTIKDIHKKTSGLSNTEMMMLCVLAMQNRPPAGVVVIGPRRFGW